MVLRPRQPFQFAAFMVGFALGIGALKACIEWSLRTGQAVPLPRFWVVWLSDANPVVYVLCDVMQRRDLCVGLHFEDGPLEGVELAWLLFAQGAPFGLTAVLLALSWRSRGRAPE